MCVNGWDTLDRKCCICPDEQVASLQPLPSAYECACEWVNVGMYCKICINTVPGFTSAEFYLKLNKNVKH